MKNIPIDQMDERRLRVELSSASAANLLLNDMVNALRDEKLILLEENRSLRKANLSFAPQQILLRAENKRLEKREQVLDALEAAGVDNWQGYDYAMELLAEEENGT